MISLKNSLKFNTILFIVLTITTNLFAQADSLIIKSASSIAANSVEKKWFESISIRGYTQIRYNRLFETNSSLGNEQGDKSWGNNGGFFIRRMRMIFFGQISKQVYFYIQPDFASSPSSDKLHFAQLRDAYFDIGLDNDNEFRVRIGQSKVPFGFENMQSSQNRLALDRNDALNSAVSNERDLGVFGYWAPKDKRALFNDLVKSGLKGSGDYGVVAIGAYNGQTANAPELNNDLHYVARVTYPLKIKNQIIEASVQGYTGKFVLSTANLSSGVKKIKDLNYTDQRLAASFIVYPQPFGFQAEYNIGKGPEFNKATDSIEVQDLKGGYVQMMYNLKLGGHTLFPFVKYQYYDGGKKHEKDARSYQVNDLEIGVEWQPYKQFELVACYTISNRRYEDFAKQDNLQKGNLLRLQAQLNF
jgi:hypothetical protein